MLRLLVLVLLSLIFTGCQKVIRSDAMNEVSRRFDIAKEQREQRAKAGQMTWVEAEQQIRDLDKGIKERMDATGAVHTWKYDSDDEEYYAFCIDLAEKLDRKQISFSEFDARRIERLNTIQSRRQLLNTQQQLLIQNSQIQQQNNVNKQQQKEDLRCTSTVWGQTVNTTCR